MKNDTNYGTVNFEGRTITLDGQAEPTSRLLPGNYRNFIDRDENDGIYDSEWSADGHYEDGTEVTVYWMQEMTDETEPDMLDWDTVDRVKLT